MMIRGDYPINKQIGYQDPGTIQIIGIYDIYDRIIYYIIMK
jgi:hypothetical protein